MSRLKLLLIRVAAFAADTAQSLVTAFGGGNGDPGVLMEPRSSSKRTRPRKRRRR